MPMRVECKYFESRSYANGETVRKCHLDLAPEAPWRCPEDCHRYERRFADAGWSYGSMVAAPTPPEPPGVGVGDGVARLLDEAEQILNTAGPSILAEVEAERARRRPEGGSWWRRALGRIQGRRRR
ncbi:MAG TPA: hypothetical protein VM386_07730 [Acidimicrobiales bacterium]|nr:hypothetical protein [Acidimicrobiales bacterium]